MILWLTSRESVSSILSLNPKFQLISPFPFPFQSLSCHSFAYQFYEFFRMNNFLQVSPYLERLLVLNPQMYPQPEGSLSLQVPTRLTHLCLMEPNLPGLHLPNLKSLIERSPDLEFVALVASPVR